MEPIGRCDSCADEGVGVVALHRIYMTPEAGDQAPSVDVQPALERWCFSCRMSYPHQLRD
jgi:hypothetical protein